MTQLTEQVRRRRTFAIISHPDAGKTTLTEKLLLYGGAIHLAGSVKARRAERHATSDWMKMEQERGISVTSSVLQFEYLGRAINLLDTPGHQDFSEDTYRTLAAVDSAVMLIDCVKGVEAQEDAGFTAAYFDQSGLYAFGRQPEAIYWDLMQLASSLRLIADEEPLIEAMDSFPEIFQREVAEAMLWRLGVMPRGAEHDRPLIGAIERVLVETNTSIDRFFFDGFGGTLPAAYGEPFAELRAQLAQYAPRKARDHAYWSDPEPCAMLIDEVEAIWSRIEQGDDWAPLTGKVAAIRRMGEALA